jgi:LmbE family N-acetylglucosaminyl deacetylase
MTSIVTDPSVDRVPSLSRVLAICAHPDDESFGLGSVLHALRRSGAVVEVMTLTHGEASTLCGEYADLAKTRADELAAASEVLGIARSVLLDYPDGHLADVDLEELVRRVRDEVRVVGPTALLVFDQGGITGHPDHCRATAAALAAADTDDFPVIAWAIPREVADTLNEEYGTAFLGRQADQIDFTLAVNREVQVNAIACHTSQSTDNPVLWRRLELLGNREYLRYLRS